MISSDQTVPFNSQHIAAWKELPVPEQARRNRERIDEFAIGWNALQSCTRADTSRPRLFYLHIPKTGGTTLSRVIVKNYRLANVVRVNYPDVVSNPGVLYNRKGQLKKVIMGHYSINYPIYQAFDKPFVHMTVLREPVARLLSYYNYLRTRPQHQGYARLGSKGFDEFIQLPDAQELENQQTRLLTGFRGLRPDDKLARDIMEIAKDTLANRFSCFGLQERYTEFLLMAHQLLGWSDLFHRRHNVSQQEIHMSDIDASMLETIRARNRLDIELYEFAHKLFEERCQKLGITRERVERFERANDRYRQLVSISF